MKKNETLSPVRLIPLGRLVNTHGVRGELRLLPYVFPCHTVRAGVDIILQDGTALAGRHTVESVRSHAPFMLVKLVGIDSREQAHALRDRLVSVEEALLPPLQEGEFYYYQVRGLKVVTTAGERIGTITDVFFSGGSDIWVVHHDQKEYLIPVVDEIVRTIDISGRQVIIEPLPGLLE